MQTEAHREVQSSSAKIRSLRLAHYLTTSELAKRLNIEESTLFEYETGQLSPPRELVESVVQLLEAPTTSKS